MCLILAFGTRRRTTANRKWRRGIEDRAWAKVGAIAAVGGRASTAEPKEIFEPRICTDGNTDILNLYESRAS
jgi:hypothetical protein